MASKIFYTVAIVWCFTSVTLFGQNSKALNEAEKLFGVKAYAQALPLYEEAIKSGVKDPNVYYHAGVCYQRSEELSDQLKAIPYFENALQNGKSLPVTLRYDLGELYLKDENLKKALETLTAYRDQVKAD